MRKASHFLLICLVTASGMCLGLTGCSSKDEPEEAKSPPPVKADPPPGAMDEKPGKGKAKGG